MKTLVAATLLYLVLSLAPCFAGVSEHSSKIDQLVEAALAKQNIKPNADADDQVFLRRTFLNIAGRVPTIEEAEAFFDDGKHRRANLIDKLLRSEAHISNAYHFWADLLRLNGQPGGPVGAAYELWVKDSLRENKPYNEMVYELVTADGKIWENGAVGYYFRDRGMPLDNMSNTVRVFLGTRLECAQCHNHPFDKWTQMDYFKMASFSYGVNTRNYNSPNRNMVSKHQRDLAVKAYHEKAKELTGRDDFPYLSVKGGIEKYERTMPEKTKIPEVVEIENPKRPGKKKNKNKRKNVRLTPHEKLGLTKEGFLDIAKQCAAAGDAATADRNAMREVLGELYDPLQYTYLGQEEKNSKLPHDYQYSDAKPNALVEPATMFGKEIDLATTEDDRIIAYGKWMTSPENPTFTKVIANRLWKEVFGHGVFEPVDELTDHTFVSNPELLDYLVEVMIELDYDMRAFQETLYNTKTFQRASFEGEVLMGAPYYFQGPVLRRMSAEQIWDSMVALALPEADRYQPKIKGQLASLNRVKRIYDRLEGQPFEEFYSLVEQIAPLVASRRKTDEENRAKLLEAKNADDEEAYRQLRRDIGQSKKVLNQKISALAFPYMKEKVDGEELLLAMGISTVSMSGGDMMSAEADSEASRQVMLKLPKPEIGEVPEELLGGDKRKNNAARKAWQQEQKMDYNIYKRLIAGMARASELQSPARRGHFLRDFGQSDREVIENASTHASVPQALNLLNGEMIKSLTNRFSVFGKRLHEAGTPTEKAEMIFQAMLTRKPTEDEVKIVQAEFEQRGEDSYEGIVWALLNTQQFMFVE